MFEPSWRCIPTSTFSSAVMFWNSRMFWNVRPMPAATTSFGRALRRIPSRARKAGVPGRPDGRDARASRRARAHADGGQDESRHRRHCRRPRAIATSATSSDGTTQMTDSSQTRRGREMRVVALEGHGPGGRVDDPGDDVEERRLAGAVRPDDADDRALRDVEVDVADGDQAAETLGHAREPGAGPRRSAPRAQSRRPESTVRSFGRRAHRIPSSPKLGVLLRVQLALAGGGSGRGPPVAAASSRRARCRRAGTGTG